MKKYCEYCGKLINPHYIDDSGIAFVEDHYYYEHPRTDICYCESCGNELLTGALDFDGYVYNEDYKDFYLDDELSDLEIFDCFMTINLEAVEPDYEEPDWDGYNDDRKLGLI